MHNTTKRRWVQERVSRRGPIKGLAKVIELKAQRQMIVGAAQERKVGQRIRDMERNEETRVLIHDTTKQVVAPFFTVRESSRICVTDVTYPRPIIKTIINQRPEMKIQKVS